MRPRPWLSKLLAKLTKSHDDVQVMSRVFRTGRCDDCGAPVSRDIMSDDSVTYVCTNEKCGHKYEVTGLSEATAEDI